MLTAHLPSGYILARVGAAPGKAAMVAALAGAIAPDFDMLWFHFVDSSLHHHRFWPHIPAIWLAIAALSLPLLRWAGWLTEGFFFFGAILLHLVLDTLAGGILWAWPRNDTLYHLVEVPATQGHWILSFLLHWTFLAELAIWAWAGALWFRRPRSGGLHA